jgi:hypothetical protein
MLSSLNCPFCHSELRYSASTLGPKGEVREMWDHYFCDDDNCLNDDMPRFQINFHKDETAFGEPISCAFMIDTYYIQIDFASNNTIISTLDGPLLIGSIHLPKALQFDMANLSSVSEKVKTLLVFS